MTKHLQRLVQQESEQWVLPKNWEWRRIEEIAEVLKPGKLYDESSVSDVGNVPVVNQSEDSYHGFHNEEPGVNASPECPVFTFANHTCHMRLMKQPYSCIQNIFSRIGVPGVSNTIYLYYASMGRVNLAGYKGHHPIYRKQWIPLPPLSEQQRIASTLYAYDDLIENNRRRIQLLEQAARLLYKEWFVHLRFPGHEHARIIDGVPEGWEKKPLSEIADITMGQSPKSIYYNEEGNGLPFHQGVTNFGARFPSHETYCNVQSRIAEPGDILFSVRAPVGRINITPDKIVIGRGLSAIRSIRDQQNYLFYALKSHFFKEDMIGGGAIFAAITKKDLYGVELMQPTGRIAVMFTGHVLPIDLQIANLQQTIDRLAKARDLLLPKLMNGEVAV